MSSKVMPVSDAGSPHVDVEIASGEIAPQARARLSRLSRSALFVAGIALYLLATLVFLSLGWLLPGRGLDAIVFRLVVGCAVPGVCAVLLQRRLRRRNAAVFATALLVGMMLVGLAGIGGGIGMAFGFRLL
jgi:hypothetical protein